MSAITQYFDDLRDVLVRLPLEQIESLADHLEATWQNGGRLLLMGNGGSSATASHIVNDLQKCFDLECGKPLKAICLTDCTPLIMAWGNDTQFANIFAPQVKCWAEPGDLVIAISGSGNSPNVIEAVEEANRIGAVTFGLAGFGGGKLAQAAQECLVVPSDNMQQVEDAHMAILHAAFSAVRDRNPAKE